MLRHLDQVAAARTALYNTGVLILEKHARECILGADESKRPTRDLRNS